MLELDQKPITKWLNYACKFALVATLVWVVLLTPDAFLHKALTLRVPIYLAPPLLVPFAAKALGWQPYPHTGDLLLSAPFLVDLLANIVGAYGAWDHTDQLIHLFNGAAAAAFLAFRFRTTHETRDAFVFAAGAGSLCALGWEFVEFLGSVEGFGRALPVAMDLTSEDTVRDLALSSLGAMAGAALGMRLLGPTTPRTRAR